MDRCLTFGKYKGQPIKKILLTHIGYIMWCKSNLPWFSLNDEEQSVYDALSIAIKKDGVQMVFPTEELCKFVKNKEALEKEETPFGVTSNGIVYPKDFNSPIVQTVLAYAEKPNSRKPSSHYDSALYGLVKSLAKLEKLDELDEYYEDGLSMGDFF